MLEADFKAWLRSGFGWSNPIEYGRGGQEGFPDVVALVRSEMLPIECKTGVIRNGVWKITEHPVLPSQVLWHYTYASAGGIAYMAIGVWNDGWSMKIVPGRCVINWKKGYKGMTIVSDSKDILPVFERLLAKEH